MLLQGLVNFHHSTDIGFPHSSVSKSSACNAGDPGLIPGLARSPGEGNGNPLQYSCLENLMDRGAWQATAHGVTRVMQACDNVEHTHALTYVSGHLNVHSNL